MTRTPLQQLERDRKHAYDRFRAATTLEEQTDCRAWLLRADALWRSELARLAGRPFAWVSSGVLS